ncbi:MAG: DUF2079 domain-containing protein [Candidatus Eisenbacteria bacterium]
MKRRTRAAAPVTARPAHASLAGVVEHWLDRHDRPAVWALTAAMTAMYSAVCVIKYRYYLYDNFDLAIFVQALDRMLHGSMFVSIRGMNWLGDHSSLSLLLLLPFYALARHPLTLLVVQAAIVMLGAVAVRRLARHEGLSGAVAVACAAAYLLYPAAGHSVLFEFHPETLSTPALLFAFLFMRQGRSVPLAIAAGLALLGKEDAALVVGAMGLYALTRRGDTRRFAHAALLGGLAAVSLVLTFAVLQPLNAGQAEYGRMYEAWGATTGEALRNMLTHPLQVAQQLVDTPGNRFDAAVKREYWLHLLMPFAFLPLLSPLVLLIALPVIAAHLLSWRIEQHTVLFQYTAFVTPFVSAAAVLGLAQLVRWSRTQRAPAASAVAPRDPGLRFGALLLAVSFACQLLFGPLVGRGVLQTRKPPQRNWPSVMDRSLAPWRDSLLARLPAEGGVVAPFEFLAHLAHRPDVHSIHHVLSGTYNFSSRPYPTPSGVTAMIVDGSMSGTWHATLASHEWLQELVSANRLSPALAAGDLLLLTRDSRAPVEIAGPAPADSAGEHPIRFDGVLDFLGGEPSLQRSRPGDLVSFRTRWRRVGEADRIYLTAVSLEDGGGRRVTLPLRNLGGVLFPFHSWPLGTVVRDPLRLVLPSDLLPGRYRVDLNVGWRRGSDNSGAAATDDPRVGSQGGWIPAGTLEVESPQR